jgi:hypothetical protein
MAATAVREVLIGNLWSTTTTANDHPNKKQMAGVATYERKMYQLTEKGTARSR